MADKEADKRVDINFESHPPIEEDLNGIATLMRQTLLQFVDCHALARYLIHRKDLTQVIAQEEPDEDEEDDIDDNDEPDDDIYGVCSVVELPSNSKIIEDKFLDCRKQLLEFIKEKCHKFKDMIDNTEVSDHIKVGFVINERYINLPPQLSLPTLKTLTESIKETDYTHLVFISKILLKSRNTDTKLPSKRSKSGRSSAVEAEPLIFINPEEEIISEEAEYFTDLDVSAHCDENASWSFGSDIKYIPHRRFIVIELKNWPATLTKLEKELQLQSD